MLIYAEQITPRLQYIAEVLFEELSFTSNTIQFYEAREPKINYSHKRFSEDEFLVQPYGLLTEAGLRTQRINLNSWDELKIFFPGKGEIPFDIFSAAFYLLSRYEEYLPHKKDMYGRFAHSESIAFKHNFLDIPLVNLWMEKFHLLLQQKFPAWKAGEKKFSFIPTYDIDIAYAERADLAGKLVQLIRQRKTKQNGQDLFDVYDWLDQLHESFHLSPLYFFLLAKRRSRYDKNLSPRSERLRKLIRRTAAKYSTGIHPSWSSYHDERSLSAEILALHLISGKDASASRQHYIQFTLPHTYRQLIDAGITDDYSMGYGSINGFRASCSSSFYWYDLLKEERTTLLLHPFCYMDANSHFEQKLSAEEAGKELQYYFNVVKKVKGQMITIFHNHFLTEEDHWLPWRKMYAAFLAQNFSKENITFLSQQEP